MINRETIYFFGERAPVGFASLGCASVGFPSPEGSFWMSCSRDGSAV